MIPFPVNTLPFLNNIRKVLDIYGTNSIVTLPASLRFLVLANILIMIGQFSAIKNMVVLDPQTQIYEIKKMGMKPEDDTLRHMVWNTRQVLEKIAGAEVEAEAQ